MIEKVNPSHPDKVADRIAGAIVDLAYRLEDNPKMAVEVLIGHGYCKIMMETSLSNETVSEHLQDIYDAVDRINGQATATEVLYTAQDEHLSKNQEDIIRCGDNGIFRGAPLTEEQKTLSDVAHQIYEKYTSDGKYILDDGRLIICQSNADAGELRESYTSPEVIVNPLGDWTGGTDVDAGATNRKLGSDMADSVTGGGLHGKDLSKADVSVNIHAFLKAQRTGQTVELCCAIGDDEADRIPYTDIVEEARKYIQSVGGFEGFAEWGLF
ncbi:MAG: S-adenosylmethionine synthetase N-terminal domain-containing protein [Lachnospiraceae bacterium]|nr:S-adenosylmethionine synthetase N-terminal domain-containing protein [Lachnospiraceae bacterium]